MSQRRLCRRTQSPQDSPHTHPLCERSRTKRTEGGLCWFCCDEANNHLQSSSDSRTDGSSQTCRPGCFLSSGFLHNSLRQQHPLCTPPPSKSDRSVQVYTAAGTSGQTGLDEEYTADPPSLLSLSCCSPTVALFCWLFFGSFPVHRHTSSNQVSASGLHRGPP